MNKLVEREAFIASVRTKFTRFSLNYLCIPLASGSAQKRALKNGNLNHHNQKKYVLIEKSELDNMYSMRSTKIVGFSINNPMG